MRFGPKYNGYLKRSCYMTYLVLLFSCYTLDEYARNTTQIIHIYTCTCTVCGEFTHTHFGQDEWETPDTYEVYNTRAGIFVNANVHEHWKSYTWRPWSEPSPNYVQYYTAVNAAPWARSIERSSGGPFKTFSLNITARYKLQIMCKSMKMLHVFFLLQLLEQQWWRWQ